MVKVMAITHFIDSMHTSIIKEFILLELDHLKDS